MFKRAVGDRVDERLEPERRGVAVVAQPPRGDGGQVGAGRVARDRQPGRVARRARPRARRASASAASASSSRGRERGAPAPAGSRRSRRSRPTRSPARGRAGRSRRGSRSSSRRRGGRRPGRAAARPPAGTPAPGPARPGPGSSRSRTSATGSPGPLSSAVSRTCAARACAIGTRCAGGPGAAFIRSTIGWISSVEHARKGTACAPAARLRSRAARVRARPTGRASRRRLPSVAWTIHSAHRMATSSVTQSTSPGANAPSATKKANSAMTASARIQNDPARVSSNRGMGGIPPTSDFVPIVASSTPNAAARPSPPAARQRERAAVGPAAQPAPPQQLVEQRRAERAGDVRPALGPVQAGPRGGAARAAERRRRRARTRPARPPRAR